MRRKKRSRRRRHFGLPELKLQTFGNALERSFVVETKSGDFRGNVLRESADSHTHQEAFKTQERLARFRERRIGSPHLLHQGEQFAPNGAGPLHESVGQFVAGVTAVAEGRNIEVPQTVEEKLVEVLALGKDVFLQEPLPNIFGACVGTVAHDAGDALQDETQSQFPTIVFARSALIGTLLFRLAEFRENITFGSRLSRPLHHRVKMHRFAPGHGLISGENRI